jgi:hypothetical protein
MGDPTARNPAITVNTPRATIHPAFVAACWAQLLIASLNSPMSFLLPETEPHQRTAGYFFAAFSTLIASASA